METMVIGITGGTCSGKTTLTRRIKEGCGEHVSVLYHDSYYKSRDGMPFEERCKLNYDHPDSFDTELLIRDLRDLKEGRTIWSPTYDYKVHNRSDKTVEVRPNRVILVEGILIFQDPVLRDLMDIRIFVDADADERILRRLDRDVRERGRSLESVVNQYLTTVKPMHDAFVEPSKKYAHIIVPQGGRNQVAFEMIMERIRGHIDPQSLQ